MTGQITLDLLVAGIICAAGVMRGITGFGGGMLMTPPLSILLGAVPAVVISLCLEAVAALIMVPATYKDLPLKQFAFLIVPACIAIPVGTQVLIGIDAGLARRLIGAMVVLSSIAMLSGPALCTRGAKGIVGRHRRASRPAAWCNRHRRSACDPVPVVGSGPVRGTRAILTAFISTTSLIGVAALVAAGAITLPLLIWSALLAAVYLAAIWIGMKLFAHLSASQYTRDRAVSDAAARHCGPGRLRRIS